MCGLAFRSLLWPVCFALADAFDLWRVQGIDIAAALAAILFQHAPGQEQRPYEAESARPGSPGSADGCFPARCGRVLVIFACAEHAILARHREPPFRCCAGRDHRECAGAHSDGDGGRALCARGCSGRA